MGMLGLAVICKCLLFFGDYVEAVTPAPLNRYPLHCLKDLQLTGADITFRPICLVTLIT